MRETPALYRTQRGRVEALEAAALLHLGGGHGAVCERRYYRHCAFLAAFAREGGIVWNDLMNHCQRADVCYAA